MPRLVIDGQPVEVEPGATILDAARRLGIAIPTLCHRDEPGDGQYACAWLEPMSACFLCVVQVEGRPTLTPACTAPAEDGMTVVTDSDDIRDARRTALELLLSDHAGDCLAPCVLACPAGLDVPGFITDALAGPHVEAIATLRARLPLAASLGRICPRFCETVCRRAHVDDPIAIRDLHRAVADRGLAADGPYTPERAPGTGKRVAIVGAGPAGLSAAFHLLARGHDCTLFDDHDEPGGRFRYGVPSFRLPPSVVAGEAAIIERLGGAFRPGVRVGRDVAFDDLRRDFDAVLIAVGAQSTAPPDCAGADLARPALDLLEQAARGDAPALNGAAVVAGGDHVAIACARTALRLGAEPVTLCWPGRRPTRGPLVALIHDAEAEGIDCRFETTLKMIAASNVIPSPLTGEGEGGGGSAAPGRRMNPDAPPPSSPSTTPGGGDASRAGDGVTVTLTCDGVDTTVTAAAVFAAMKRSVEPDVATAAGLSTGSTGITVDRRTMATSTPGIFAAGEAVTGGSFGVRAVAAGRLAAVAIDQFLAGADVTGEAPEVNVRIGTLSESDRAALFGGVEQAPRAAPERLDPTARRTTFDEVTAGLTDAAVEAEMARCLQCSCRKVASCRLRRHAAEYGADPRAYAGEHRPLAIEAGHADVVFEPGKCILCGLCLRIAADARERLGLTFVGRGFQVRTAVPFGETIAEGLRETAEACARACPTAAISLVNRREKRDG